MVGIKIKKLNEKLTLLRKTFPKCKIEVVKTSNLYPRFWKTPDALTHEIVIRDFFSHLTTFITSKITISPQPNGYSIRFIVWVKPIYPKDVDAAFHDTPSSQLRTILFAKRGALYKFYDFLFTNFSKFEGTRFDDFLEINMRRKDKFDKFILRIEINIFFKSFDQIVSCLADFQKKWKQEGGERKFMDHKYNPAISVQRMRTIFVLCKNENLKKAVEECAEKLDSTVCYGEPSSPDIIALPHFVSIVDRTLVGAEYWDKYLKFCSDTRCIIVDNNDAFAWPKNKMLKDKKGVHFDINDKRSISKVVAIIRKIRMDLKKEAFKNSKKLGFKSNT
ncbi:MAG TPA: hypothetical protein DCY12_06730 [Candidatus Atribacteria bacterium]|nr:hypothetical protein [Candidatus Atribacteria bacterium]